MLCSSRTLTSRDFNIVLPASLGPPVQTINFQQSLRLLSNTANNHPPEPFCARKGAALCFYSRRWCKSCWYSGALFSFACPLLWTPFASINDGCQLPLEYRSLKNYTHGWLTPSSCVDWMQMRIVNWQWDPIRFIEDFLFAIEKPAECFDYFHLLLKGS